MAAIEIVQWRASDKAILKREELGSTGIGRGVMRVGSGFVDVATFPVPFDHNRPLFKPEFAL